MQVSACIYEYVCVCVYVWVYVCVHQGADTDRKRGMSGPRADPGDTIHQGEIRGRWESEEETKRREKKERDPRRDVTLPNHQDGGKVRLDSKGSSASSTLQLCYAHQP